MPHWWRSSRTTASQLLRGLPGGLLQSDGMSRKTVIRTSAEGGILVICSSIASLLCWVVAGQCDSALLRYYMVAPRNAKHAAEAAPVQRIEVCLVHLGGSPTFWWFTVSGAIMREQISKLFNTLYWLTSNRNALLTLLEVVERLDNCFLPVNLTFRPDYTHNIQTMVSGYKNGIGQNIPRDIFWPRRFYTPENILYPYTIIRPT